jgi:hypothetical protein
MDAAATCVTQKWAEGEENNVEEDPQPGTSTGGVTNWGCQLGRHVVFRPLTGAPINKGSTVLHYTGITSI